MTDRSIAFRVAARYRADIAARFVARAAGQAPGSRRKVRENVTPVNRLLNVPTKIQKQEGKEQPPKEDGAKADRRDIRPQDVFKLTPENAGVRNFAETGRDNQSGKVDVRIKDDRGFATVRNLSQYLIRTEGGGDTPPQGSKP